jgi:futalosine hydrolase
MKILIVAATDLELQPVIKKLTNDFGLTRDQNNLYHAEGFSVMFLESGVGSMMTAVSLLRSKVPIRFDLWIQIGIAGSFTNELSIGQVVEVTRECFGDLGIEQKDGSFADVFEAGLTRKDLFPFADGTLINPVPYTSFPKVSGVTVNRVSGTHDTISASINKFGADIETMEGGGFFLCSVDGKHPVLPDQSHFQQS